MSPTDIPVAIGLVSVAIQALIAAQLFSISRAPGWKHARPFAWVVLTAALYGVVYTAAASQVVSPTEVGRRVSAYLLVGTANAAAWLWFARVPDVRRWRDLPRSVAWHIGTAGLLVAGLLAGADVVDFGRTVQATAFTLGANYERPLLSLAGIVAAAVVVSLYAAAVRALWARRREPGMRLIVSGYCLFLLAVALELGIATLGWRLLVPAPIGFLLAVLPVAMGFQHRFLQDAERLAWLSNSLQGQLASRTEERDAARDALWRQEQVASIGRLASGLAHELSNPLQHAALALHELESLPSVAMGGERRLLHEVALGVDRMQDIVHRLHDLVEYADWHMESVSLPSAVRHAVALTAVHCTGVELEVVHDGPAASVRGHEPALVRALVALLLNAASAARQAPAGRSPTIAITLRTSSEGQPSVEILDSGLGFPEEVVALAGEPFVTAGETPGLGLFMVHRIMRAHGGRVIVGNTPGGGARVALVFPSAPHPVGHDRDTGASAPAAHQGPATAPASAGRAVRSAIGESGPSSLARHVSPLSASVASATILVVDDEPLVRNAFARVLERAGHHVLRAGDGREALDLLRTDIVDLVITDLMMPGMNGVEFAGVLAEGHPSLREHLIVICGGAVTQDAVQFLNTPGLRVLNKPVSPAELTSVVVAALAERGLSGRELPSYRMP